MKRVSTTCLAMACAVLVTASAHAGESTDTDKALQHIDAFIESAGIDKSEASWKTKLPKPTVAEFTAENTYLARMRTNKGEIVIRFMPDVAPMHVTTFMYLTRLGFYDGLSFHRVIPGFMAQGGCPLGSGNGNPGFRFAGEYDPTVIHDRPGRLSAANTGRPNTDGSQFFLTFVATPHLDGKHTIFGEVVEGMEVLKALEKAGTRGSGRPRERLVMEEVVIEVGA